MKHVLITGGNKGIGLETTKLFLNAGYFVTVVARDIAPIKDLKNCEGVVFDLRNVGGIAKLVSELKPVDILINNAGMLNKLTYRNYPEDTKADTIKLNLEAPVELMTCISKSMIERKQGRIVNNASIASHIGHPDIWYGITKAGLLNATRTFAKELGPHGIVVNAVAAGPVETDMIHTIPDARKDAILRTVYSGRFCQPIEVAQAMYWLATDCPEYINGICIDINNGAFPR